MENQNLLKNQTSLRNLPIACATSLAVSFMVSLPHLAHADYADRVTPPPVPTDLEVPAGNKAFLVGHAGGSQNYICLPSDGGYKFILFTPQATLFNDDDKQIITHFFSPNPDEGSTIRAAWQHSKDSSTVWGRVRKAYSESDFVAAGAIPWLLIERVGKLEGPTGGHKLTRTTYIQRVNTAGGVAPETGCESEQDVGHQEFVPYTADYFFYKKAYKHDEYDY